MEEVMCALVLRVVPNGTFTSHFLEARARGKRTGNGDAVPNKTLAPARGIPVGARGQHFTHITSENK